LGRETSDPFSVEGAPKRSEAQGSRRFRSELNLRIAKRDTAYRMGSSRWNAGVRPMRFDREASERRGRAETFFRPSGRRKASKGEAQERWELKEASKDGKG